MGRICPARWLENLEVITSGDNTIDFLLVGQDRRPGGSRARSDAMILVTIDKSAKTLTMTSFLRDTWVKIPGYFNERLNVPYVLGGVDIELTAAEASHLNGQNYAWGLKEGENHLDGEQALAYSRIRYLDTMKNRSSI